MSRKNEVKNLIINAVITATSKKQSPVYKTDNPRKTVYFRPVTDLDAEKLVSFGMKAYTSEEEELFFIVKTAESVPVYATAQDHTPTEVLDGTDTGDNFDSNEKKVQLNIIKGHNRGNDFYRLQAILGEVSYVAPSNPFDVK